MEMTLTVDAQALPHSRTLSTLGSIANSSSFDGEDALLETPRDTGKLSGLFLSDAKAPSPPKINGKVVDMEVSEVGSRMRKLGIFIPWLLSSNKYKKLDYLIGKDVDVQIIEKVPWYKRAILVFQLLNESSLVGQRFEALYRSDGDTLWESPENADTTSLEIFLLDILPEWSVDSYTVFRDNVHRNMEVFYRLQESGNCYLQAPILLHWYLTLWRDPDMIAQNVDLIHLSKYVPNTFTAEHLYNYVVNEEGGSAMDIAYTIMPDAAYLNETVGWGRKHSYEEVLGLLKKYGPAIAEVTRLHEDFQEKWKFRYEGLPPTGPVSGHAMLLVGVRNVSVESFVGAKAAPSKLLGRKTICFSASRLLYCF